MLAGRHVTNRRPVGRPSRRLGEGGETRDEHVLPHYHAELAPFGVHDPELKLASPVGEKDNLSTIGRPVGTEVCGGVIGKPAFGSGFAVDEPDFVIPGAVGLVDDLLPVG